MENSQNLSLGYSTNKWKRGTVKFLCIKLMPANTGWTSVFILKPPAWESDECREMLVCICVKMSLSILCVPSTAKKQVRRYLNWLENSVMTKVILHLLWRAWLKTLGMFAAGCSSPVISTVSIIHLYTGMRMMWEWGMSLKPPPRGQIPKVTYFTLNFIDAVSNPSGDHR